MNSKNYRKNLLLGMLKIILLSHYLRTFLINEFNLFLISNLINFVCVYQILSLNLFTYKKTMITLSKNV